MNVKEYKALVDEARDYQKNSHSLSKGDARTYAGVQAVRSATADFIGRMADAVEALDKALWVAKESQAELGAERDALRAQLDAMTTEEHHRYVPPRSAQGGVLPGGRLVREKRLVGPWVEVTD